jgi:hypothetical protein
MIQDVTIPARLARCEVCQYEWITILTPPRLPMHCMNRECRSREWNGKKKRKPQDAKPKIVLPKTVKVRGGEDDFEF